MSRGGSKRRLTRTLPVLLAVVGAGITAARKRRAARHPQHGLMDRIEPLGQPLAPAPVSPAAPEAGVAPAPPEAGASPAAARGAVKTIVLDALAAGGAMTAAEIAAATGTSRATISSTLTRLARSGEVTKAERGYQLPDAAARAASAATPAPTRAAKPAARRGKATKASSKPSPARRRTRASSSSSRAGTPRMAPGATRATVLAALSKDQGATSGEVAKSTGLARGTVSTTLSRLAKTGEVVKAERGYVLPS